jgi:hypothetical protein
MPMATVLEAYQSSRLAVCGLIAYLGPETLTDIKAGGAYIGDYSLANSTDAAPVICKLSTKFLYIGLP